MPPVIVRARNRVQSVPALRSLTPTGIFAFALISADYGEGGGANVVKSAALHGRQVQSKGDHID